MDTMTLVLFFRRRWCGFVGHVKPRELWSDRRYLRYACDYCGTVSPVRGIFEYHMPADAWELGFGKLALTLEDWKREVAAAKAEGREFTEPMPYVPPEHTMTPPRLPPPIPRDTPRVDVTIRDERTR